MIKSKSSEILNKFLTTRATFELFHGSRQFANDHRVLVLDSSFNPPHNGHYMLVKKAVEHFKNTNLHVILLLSIKNADKEVKPASFDKRMDMMCILCDLLEKNSIKTSVGVTRYGKFVQKSEAMHRNMGNNFKLCYLVGFDTITRIFDSKFYEPLLTADALKSFMVTTEFFCLTRSGDADSVKQLNYPNDIAEGKFEPEIPRSWHRKIVVEENDPSTQNISSTMLRKAIFNRENDTTALIPKEIYQYVTNNHPGVNIFEP
ncbi:LAME_0G00848g1_1 [Lachancea meyersii CBS 8951]|uniref:LAME_0G00848g1_1 n=1 Tax=Lachancea meyersii CBS 8951 TaxID=1266667 RepID=A0A1G4K523_9SACH|nr:LAME_0G00848g1_1 [Lachancea meyersii CBS 8951]